MPELERWVLHRLAELDRLMRQGIADYDYHAIFTALHNFCAVDLSAFYFDIRKDRLYCDGSDDLRRRATRTVLDRTFDCLVRWLAPILCFTAEEAWLARYGDSPADDQNMRSIHCELFAEAPAEWHDAVLAARWGGLRDLRRVVTGALEIARAEKRIGSSVQAAVHIFAPASLVAALGDV
ncbi:MAG TPA: class I tRNA ligase family protein, partial [Nevskia sp.]|nr:class I tRNA ligase family protein [Nevskia sp.]